MTEDDARKKWCPMVQVTSAQHMNDIEYGDNRGGGDSDHNCIASDCMVWQWKDETAIDPTHPNTYKRLYMHGYCGLANKP